MNLFPKHIGIIMDGNRRWAEKRGLPSEVGHSKGSKIIKDIISKCVEINLKELSMFGFSTENWSREEKEIKSIIRLIEIFLNSEIVTMNEKNIKFKFVGNITRFNPHFQKLLLRAEHLTKNNNGLILNAALNYGGAMDFVTAAKKIALQVKEDKLTIDNINETIFRDSLLSNSISDIDLLIRTSGEQRLSNFLLWQCRYSELYFSKTLWPDFSKKDLVKAIDSFSKRERRYGSSLLNGKLQTL